MSEPPELLPVPTVQDLVRRGLATTLAANKQGVTTLAHVSSKGHDLMGEAMLENGRRLREHDAATRNVPRETSPQRLPDILPHDDPWFDLGSHSIDK